MVSSGHIGKSSQIKVNKAKYNQLKPPLTPRAPVKVIGVNSRAFAGSLRIAHNPTRNPNLNLRHRPTTNVAHCRRSKIRPKTYTLNLNTRRAGLPAGKAGENPASGINLNGLCNTARTPHRSLHRVAPRCSELHRVAPEFFHTPLQHLFAPGIRPASLASYVEPFSPTSMFSVERSFALFSRTPRQILNFVNLCKRRFFAGAFSFASFRGMSPPSRRLSAPFSVVQRYSVLFF